MKLKKYQEDTLSAIKAFFDAFDTKTPGEAYESVTSSADKIARLGNLRKYEAAANDTPTVVLDSETYEAVASELPDEVKVAANADGSGTIEVTAEISDDAMRPLVE